ncbi:MAG: hypothetical protein HY360_07600 [Verrucomicrobia bacterium]|nr:hypothetical protein [Verrucomicrobiota bacterium]
MNPDNLKPLLTVLIVRLAEVLARQEVTMRQLALLTAALTPDAHREQLLAEIEHDYETRLHSHQFAIQKDLQRLRAGQKSGTDWLDPDPQAGDPDR